LSIVLILKNVNNENIFFKYQIISIIYLIGFPEKEENSMNLITFVLLKED